MSSVLVTSDGTSKTTASTSWSRVGTPIMVLKHDTAAIECFLLMTFLAFILCHAFLYLNVKPSFRQGKSKDFWARVMAAEIYQDFIPSSPPP